MGKEFEIITEIKGVKFLKGNKVLNEYQIIFTDDENFRVPLNSDLVKECNRIYNNYYK